MNKLSIRLLRADEIECRIGTISDKGLSLLLYKDARADMKILDETFGVLGWKRSHQCINGNLYCTIELWDGDKKQWISKQNVGIEAEIPHAIQIMMFESLALMERKAGELDRLQVFRLTTTEKDVNIRHEQEIPEASMDYFMPVDEAVNAKVYIIDDVDHVTMLLAEEY